MAALPALLDVQTAAERLGVSPRFLRYQVAAGRIAHVRLGRSLRFDSADLDAFVEAGRRPAVSA